ncbi:MAG: universal stress protein [Verrucomicrobium sp.]|nr:universal stress protein [Verrucomicrobium sp.]
MNAILPELHRPFSNRPAMHESARNNFRRVLVCTDFSPLSRVGIDAAISLFNENPAAELSLLHVLEPANPTAPGAAGSVGDQILEEYIFDAEQKLSHLCKIYGEAVPLHSRVELGSPSAAICDIAREGSFDLIVLTSHGRSGLARALIGSVAEGVVQGANCPVLVIKLPRSEKGDLEGGPAHLSLDEIVVGYDHRREAQEALRIAATLTDRHGAHLTLVHAVEPVCMIGDAAGAVHAETRRQMFEARSLLHPLFTSEEPGSNQWTLLVEAGLPWEVLLQCADRTHADLLIVGPHEHNRWGADFAGSTAQRIVRLARCPVLVVK